MTWHPKPSLTVETLHWTSRPWILCLSSLPPDSGTLISKGNAKCTFIREHNFGPLSSSPVLFVFSPGETLLTLSVVQEWLDTRNATAETHVLHTSVRSGSWSTDSSCSPLFVNLPTFLNGFCFTILSRVRLSLLLVHFFLPHLFLPFASLLMSWTQSSVNSQPLLQWPFVSCPPCARCQWSSFGQLSSQRSSPWLCSLQN